LHSLLVLQQPVRFRYVQVLVAASHVSRVQRLPSSQAVWVAQHPEIGVFSQRL
jgi:hypothetical protein